MIHRIVLDTNIIVSSILSIDGKPHRIVKMALDDEFTIFLNDGIMAEYKEVLLRDRLKLDIIEVENVLVAIKKVGVNVYGEPSSISLPDEDDRKFYDTAKSSGAILLTGNKKHFPNEDFILSASEFLDLYEGER